MPDNFLGEMMVMVRDSLPRRGSESISVLDEAKRNIYPRERRILGRDEGSAAGISQRDDASALGSPTISVLKVTDSTCRSPRIRLLLPRDLLRCHSFDPLDFLFYFIILTPFWIRLSH